MLKEDSFKFDVITPIIMRGAEKQEEFRIPSIKGVMRFWFRTLMGCFIDDIKKLYEVESNIFGSTSEKSKIIIKINQFDKGSFVKMSYIDYRYFLFPFRENEHRVKWIKDGGNFSLRCSFKDIDPQIIEATFKLISLFGGLGARTRRGFGSVCLSDFNIINEDDFIKKFKSIIKFYKDYSNSKSINYSLREYSSFVSGKILFYKELKSDWSSILKNFERIYSDYRRHINIYDRYNFGLPIESYKRKNDIFSKRRASPLFFKIIKLSENGYLPIIFTLYSSKLLEGKDLNINIIDEFLNNLNGNVSKYEFNEILREA